MSSYLRCVLLVSWKLRVLLVSVTRSVYWYQGVLRTQRRVQPASVRILIEAASASLTVSFTDCIRFWALWTNMSVAWSGKHLGGRQLKLSVIQELLYCTVLQFRGNYCIFYFTTFSYLIVILVPCISRLIIVRIINSHMRICRKMYTPPRNIRSS